ncbi:hypothetical protein Slin15195_G113380 [Septoria linicola]|uniref:Uncharacterized protein n=1 Tax=Septoria linicola TaxID=215465 RepID=A0A9Q9EPT0_9PEZI|nr:hypothetical protein Slin15195_G113380 [Septoria linicola]
MYTMRTVEQGLLTSMPTQSGSDFYSRDPWNASSDSLLALEEEPWNLAQWLQTPTMASAETRAPLDTEHADPLLPTAQSIISPATRREAPNIADGAHEQAHDASHWLTKVFDRQAFLDLELRANEERQEFDDPRANALYAPNRHFGGLPFSGAIAANHHTRVVQEAQTRALHLPQWEALPLYTANATNDPMAGIMSSLQASCAGMTLARHRSAVIMSI